MDLIPFFVTVKERQGDRARLPFACSQRLREMFFILTFSLYTFLTRLSFAFFLSNRLELRRLPAPIGGTHHPGAEHAKG